MVSEPLVGIERAKRAAAEAAALVARDGMRLGLGSGSTVAHLLPALAARGLRDLRCVATSRETEASARALGLPVEPFDGLEQLDLAIDGADQVTPDWWLVKGGGGAHLREKVVAAAAERFVVIVSPDKLVEAVVAPVPLELLSFGLPATLHALGPATALRPGWPASPDGGVIADYTGPIDDVAAFSAWLAAMPGVLDHGIFPSAMVTDVIVGHPDGTAEALGRAA